MLLDGFDPNRKAVLNFLHRPHNNIGDQVPRYDNFAPYRQCQMINSDLSSIHKPRVCAVSYLNTVPLVWGIEHGAQRDIFDMTYALPSECADQLASGEADIGIVPVIEMARQKLDYFRSTGIACRGAVRSILLVSKVPLRDIKTLATDAGSRTSVMLARIVLAEKYGVQPNLMSRRAELATMLGEADAALVIGDPALHLDPATLPFETLDLGLEWTQMTSLPMVFALWSGKKEIMRQAQYEQAFLDSCRAGLAHMDQIVREQSPIRGVGEQLARDYLTRHIVFELNDRDHEGLRLYLEKAAALDRKTVGVSV
jgi:chorismate dehydratase